ncbi:MAG: hypothetical protein IPO77_18860 [Acidobacteria bacterium]|nr:hypothetical protein [Acidobacteriota bacterium]
MRGLTISSVSFSPSGAPSTRMTSTGSRVCLLKLSSSSAVSFGRRKVGVTMVISLRSLIRVFL